MSDNAAQQDQLRAASAAAEQHADNFRNASTLGGTTEQPVPPWVHERLHEHNAVIAAGHGITCVHIALQPLQPTFIALWKPGVRACAKCAVDMLTVTGVADKTCDGCRQYFIQGVRPLCVTQDQYVVHSSACASCAGVAPCP